MNRRAFLAAPVLAATACSRPRQRVIGMVPMGRSHMFWQSIHAGANAAAREAGAIIEWNGPATELDYNGQLQIVDAMINKRLDAIALAPIDRKAMTGVVERAAGQGIPVIIFDSGIATDRYVSYIATDNRQGGEMAADRIGIILKGKGKVAMVMSQPGSTSTLQREAGFEERLAARYPGVLIVDKRFGMADFAQSLKVSENMLTAHPDLDALFASNESSTVGANQALKGRAGSRVKLVGFDFSPALIEDLRAGRIDSLVVQNPFRIGYETVQTALNALNGQRVEKVRELAPRLILKEDLDKPDVRAQLNPDLKKHLN